jgi:hypothetical protein
MQVNIDIINQGDLPSVILVLFWLYHCVLPSLAKIFMFCILFYIWNTTSGIRVVSLAKKCGLICFQGRDIFRRLKDMTIFFYVHKPIVGE